MNALRSLVWLALLPACRETAPPPPPAHDAASSPAIAPAPPANAVQAEMRVLQEAARDWVVAIAAGDPGAIPEGLHRVHAARAETEKAIEAGAYRPPRNPGELEAFLALDEAFHGELVKLLEAAGRRDAAAAARQVGVVLEGCVSCHARFRFDAPGEAR